MPYLWRNKVTLGVIQIDCKEKGNNYDEIIINHHH